MANKATASQIIRLCEHGKQSEQARPQARPQVRGGVSPGREGGICSFLLALLRK